MTLPQLYAAMNGAGGGAEAQKDDTEKFAGMVGAFASHTGRNKFNINEVM